MGADWFRLLGDVAEALGAGDDIKRVFGGADAYAEGRSTETTDAQTPTGYVYERRLTRPREPNVNDR